MITTNDFWAAIRDKPGDDAPRLVYADWLEERGDTASAKRATFIRLQIERAKVPSHIPCGWAKHNRKRNVYQYSRCPTHPGSGGDGPCQHLKPNPPHSALLRQELTLRPKSPLAWFPELEPIAEVVADGQAPVVRWRKAQPVFTLFGPGVGVTIGLERGFMATVDANLSALIDCVCHYCSGDGLRTPPPEARPCRPCHGRGRSRGILAALNEVALLTRATAGDCKPSSLEDGCFVWQYVWDDIAVSMTHCLPNRLWRRLDLPNHRYNANFKHAPSERAAKDALSDALLDLVRNP